MQSGGAIRQEGLVPLIQLLSSIWFHGIFYIQRLPSLLRFTYNLSEDKFYLRWLKYDTVGIGMSYQIHI